MNPSLTACDNDFTVGNPRVVQIDWGFWLFMIGCLWEFGVEDTVQYVEVQIFRKIILLSFVGDCALLTDS